MTVEQLDELYEKMQRLRFDVWAQQHKDEFHDAVTRGWPALSAVIRAAQAYSGDVINQNLLYDLRESIHNLTEQHSWVFESNGQQECRFCGVPKNTPALSPTEATE